MFSFIKKYFIPILLTTIISIIIAYLLGFSRVYRAFGGEDLLPFMVIFGWVVKYLTEEDKRW